MPMTTPVVYWFRSDLRLDDLPGLAAAIANRTPVLPVYILDDKSPGTWRTGYPFGVNLAHGYPRFNPGEYTAADVLARREADAALIVAADPMANFTQAARDHLATIPYIALDPHETPTTRGATVAFAVATYGINSPGTVYRMDSVPIPLRPAFESPLPSDLAILEGIEKQVRAED